MSEHVIFLIHGMGEFKEKWSEGIQKIIRDSFNSYCYLAKALPFDTNYKFQEITYDHIFQSIREKMDTPKTRVVNRFLEKLKSATDKLADSDKFLFTHLQDVVLYRFTMVGDYVRAYVQTKLLEAALNNLHSSYSIIAHSMGTAVTHDALSALYNSKIVDPSQFGFNTILMCANVVKLLEDSRFPAYESELLPFHGTACDDYLNAFNTTDPIACLEKYDPDVPQDGNTYYEEIAFKSKNVLKSHDFETYLKEPKVHIKFFQRLIGYWDNNYKSLEKELETLYKKESAGRKK